ncbi:MAG: hypothetical protein Q8L79_13485 [Methylobacter sp.]|uniref:hypothetical protein n=1 Tax=Methylobacter sp. TaxID=2051955 RepID=UPI0027316898|nr:hypothetical protein [Methylobacter sp.]MDP1666118.1 hypothetical protein [Methylobacter sp.]
MSRDKNLGFDEQACSKCRQKSFETCSVCRRYRQTTLTPDGHKICKKCSESGEIPCSVCHEPMPAGYGNQCETCSLKQRRDKTIYTNCKKFADAETGVLYLEFSSWLENRSGLKKTVSMLNRYLKFFIEIELLTQDSISYPILLAKYGADGLRRWMQPVSFLIEKFSLSVSEDEKLKDSERRRIVKIMNKLSADNQSKKWLDEYYGYLLERNKTSIKSVRLAMTPVVDLLKTIDNGDLPIQRDLNVFLKKKPGQRAAISGFVGFLKNRHKVNWVLPKQASKSKIYAKQEAERKLVKLLRNPVATDVYQQKLLKAKLLYFHGLVLKSMTEKIEIKETDQKLKYVELSGKRYWLPSL